jgi:hypothetical protein
MDISLPNPFMAGVQQVTLQFGTTDFIFTQLQIEFSKLEYHGLKLYTKSMSTSRIKHLLINY